MRFRQDYSVEGPSACFGDGMYVCLIRTIVSVLTSYASRKICSFFMLLIALCLAEICSA